MTHAAYPTTSRVVDFNPSSERCGEYNHAQSFGFLLEILKTDALPELKHALKLHYISHFSFKQRVKNSLS